MDTDIPDDADGLKRLVAELLGEVRALREENRRLREENEALNAENGQLKEKLDAALRGRFAGCGCRANRPTPTSGPKSPATDGASCPPTCHAVTSSTT